MSEHYTDQQVAMMLGFDPDAQETWPHEAIRKLVVLAKWGGREKFIREINRMTSKSAV